MQGIGKGGGEEQLSLYVLGAKWLQERKKRDYTIGAPKVICLHQLGEQFTGSKSASCSSE